MAALQVYIDDSYDKRLFYIAGGIASVDQWMKFSEAWQAMLDMKPAIKCLKANQAFFQSSNDPVAKYRLLKAADIVAEHVSYVVSAQLWLEDYQNEMKGKVKSDLDSPYVACWHALMFGLARYFKAVGVSDYAVDWILDDQSHIGNRFLDWYDQFKTFVPKETLGEKPIMRNDEVFLPLQAADLIAWSIRSWEGHFGRSGQSTTGEIIPLMEEGIKRDVCAKLLTPRGHGVLVERGYLRWMVATFNEIDP